MIFLGFAVRMVDNFFIKNHYKYKVSIPEIGEVYILSMLNEDILAGMSPVHYRKHASQSSA